MNNLILWAFVLGSLALIYVFIARPWLARQPALADVYKYLDEHEGGSLSRLRVSFSGLKRLLFARVISIAGFLLSIHELVLPHIGDFMPIVPDKYRVYVFPVMTALGLMFEFLSKLSPTPVGEVNPGVIADTTSTPLSQVVEVTKPDPVVALPTQEQK